MKYSVNDGNINLVLFQSKLSMALVACRIVKTFGMLMGRQLNETERYLIRFSAVSMIVGTATIFDKERSAVNLRKTVEQWATDEELAEALKKVDRLQTMHADTIKHVLDYRNNLVAHTNKGLDNLEKFLTGPAGDVAANQRLVKGAIEILESLEKYPTDLKVKTLDYHRIREDLKE